MHHIIIGCPFSRQIWHDVLAWVRATTHPPSGDEFLTWCTTAIAGSPSGIRKGLAMLATLTAWCIWKHRNRCVFDGDTPSISTLFASIQDEARTWARASACGLNLLLA